MPIKNVLVYVDNDKACSSRVQAAVELCKQFDAHLLGLYIERKIIIPTYAGMDIPMEIFDNNDEITKSLRESAEAIALEAFQPSGNKSEFRAIDGNASHTVNSYSRYADLLIVPQMADEEQEQNPKYNIDDLLLGAACPVLMVPNNILCEWHMHRALIAWDGSFESTRALKAALPFLKQAENVAIVSVSSDEIDTGDITHYLGLHGIDTEVHFVKGSSFDPGVDLLATAASPDSQFLVMGAYGHSRLREILLGGATKHVLANAKLPVLFSH